MAVLKKAIYLFLISVVAVTISSWAFGGGPGGGLPTDGQKGPKGLFGILDEDQRETVKAMLEENREEMEGLREEMDSLRAELHELIKSEAGATTLDAKIEEIGALHTEMMKNQVNLRVEIRKLLTEEQKAQLDEMEAEMGTGGRMGGPDKGLKHGKGGRGPGAGWPPPEDLSE
ncbi:MAG: Spy/CpxP family protein refolding chaperone [Candidatus Coatesbacteria bacterium]|nr:MAG: Spy/CpxP family protein refolding chaperone [Candidatus Coatesbacteria bacterium]